MTSRRRDEGGAAVVLAAGLLALVCVLVVALGRIGTAAVARAQADAVADVVALSAVVDPAQASSVAAANGASLVQLAASGRTQVVEVVVHGHRSTAAAAATPR